MRSRSYFDDVLEECDKSTFADLVKYAACDGLASTILAADTINSAAEIVNTESDKNLTWDAISLITLELAVLIGKLNPNFIEISLEEKKSLSKIKKDFDERQQIVDDNEDFTGIVDSNGAPSWRQIEMDCLARMIQRPEFLPLVHKNLAISDFYYSEHRQIFATIMDLFEEEGVSPVSAIAARLKKVGYLALCGGHAYLNNLELKVLSLSSNEVTKLLKNRGEIQRILKRFKKESEDQDDE